MKVTKSKLRKVIHDSVKSSLLEKKSRTGIDAAMPGAAKGRGVLSSADNPPEKDLKAVRQQDVSPPESGDVERALFGLSEYDGLADFALEMPGTVSTAHEASGEVGGYEMQGQYRFTAWQSWGQARVNPDDLDKIVFTLMNNVDPDRGIPDSNGFIFIPDAVSRKSESEAERDAQQAQQVVRDTREAEDNDKAIMRQYKAGLDQAWSAAAGPGTNPRNFDAGLSTACAAYERDWHNPDLLDDVASAHITLKGKYTSVIDMINKEFSFGDESRRKAAWQDCSSGMYAPVSESTEITHEELRLWESLGSEQALSPAEIWNWERSSNIILEQQGDEEEQLEDPVTVRDFRSETDEAMRLWIPRVRQLLTRHPEIGWAHDAARMPTLPRLADGSPCPALCYFFIKDSVPDERMLHEDSALALTNYYKMKNSDSQEIQDRVARFDIAVEDDLYGSQEEEREQEGEEAEEERRRASVVVPTYGRQRRAPTTGRSRALSEAGRRIVRERLDREDIQDDQIEKGDKDSGLETERQSGPIPPGDMSEFFQEVIRDLGGTPKAEPVRFLIAQAAYENAGTTNNPLATTFSLTADTGMTKYNNCCGGVGVKNYSTFEHGVSATAKTLSNGHYPTLLSFIKGAEDSTAEETLSNTTVGEELDTWGGTDGGRYARGVSARLSQNREAENAVISARGAVVDPTNSVA